jgi:hypothetical protein
VTPFRYPKTSHQRTETPREYRRYQSYKPFLRREFDRQCVYCRLPDGMKGTDSFGVDHYRPKEKFPELSTAYTNLFYYCNACNSWKGEFWPGRDLVRLGVFIPNPCDHVMWDHLRYREASVEARSNAGNFTLDLLHINDQGFIEYREMIIDAIRALQRRRTDLLTTAGHIKERADRVEDADKEYSDVMNDLARIERHLTRLGVVTSYT